MIVENLLTFQIDNQLLSANKWQLLSCQAEPWDDDMNPLAGLSPADLPAGVSATQRPALKIEFDVTPRNYYYSFDVSFTFLLLLQILEYFVVIVNVNLDNSRILKNLILRKSRSEIPICRVVNVLEGCMQS